jgi:uncharacterized membrane protein YvlD (DUF360 family)
MEPARAATSPGPLRIALRAIAVLLIDAAALLILSAALERFTLDGPAAALAAAALVGLLNALVWPTLARLTLPLSVLSLGTAAILLNALLVFAVIELIPGAEIGGVPEAVVVALGLTALTALFSSLLALGDDDSWYRNVVARGLRRRGEAVETDIPGILFLEVDGLAHEIAVRALRDGTTPTLARWVSEGSHRLRAWETDLSSQTGACQAGILHGNNYDMPAFRWWEKRDGRTLVTNHPRDAAEIERRQSDGRGLLHADGASRANILSGDAPHSMLTMSTVLQRRRPLGRDYAAYFAQPYAAFRTFGGALADFFRERRAARRQRRRDVRPRIERGRAYAAVRAWATAVQLDLQVAAVVGDLLAGRPVVYTTFLAYDEVAHHSGIERADTLAVLAKVDRQLARIEAALAGAPRPYRLVVLSDHGQSQGATFRQRYGLTLEGLVADACERGSSIEAAGGGEDEASAFLGAGLTELGRDETAAGRAVRVATRRQRDADTEVVATASSSERAAGADPEAREGEGEQPPELSVMASGCLGLISFPREPGRLERGRIETLHPRLLETLRGHPGIGFVLVRDGGAPVVFGPAGERNLCTGELRGEDPLAPFGPNAAAHLLRTDSFPNCPDLLVNSAYWPETEEVAAFEELVGSHGGIGGPQSHPFVCHPAELPWPEQPVVGAEAIYRIFCDWLAELGQEAYAGLSGSDSPGASSTTSTPGARATTWARKRSAGSRSTAAEESIPTRE